MEINPSKISINYLKRIHDKPTCQIKNEDGKLGELFVRADCANMDISFWDKLATNKWDRAKKEAREYLNVQIKNIKDICSRESIDPENILNKISKFFTKFDHDLFYQKSINIEDKIREFKDVLNTEEIYDDISDIQIRDIIEYGILLSYHQKENFDIARSWFLSCFGNNDHRCTKSIEKIKEEVQKKYANKKLLIAVDFSSMNHRRTRENLSNNRIDNVANEAKFKKLYGMNSFEFARQGLIEGAQIHSQNDLLNSPFYRVVIYNSIGIIKEFILHKTCMDKLSKKEFFAPFHLAIEYGYKEMIEELLKYNNQINVEDALGDQGKNLLHEAIHWGQTEIAELIFNTKKLNLNAVDVEGNTVLHLASAKGNLKLISLFMDAGADAYALNNENKSSIDLARERGSNIKRFPEADDLIHSILQKRALELMKEAKPILDNAIIDKNLHLIIQSYCYSRQPESVAMQPNDITILSDEID